MPGRQSNARPGRQWSRRFNHPYTARKNPPRTTLPVFGCNEGTPWALLNSAVGPVYGFRGYNTPAQGLPASWPGPGAPVPAGLPASGTIISYNPDLPTLLSGSMDAALATFFATVPAGAFISFWAEGENHQPAYLPADLIAGHTRVNGIFQKNAPVSAHYGQITATFSAVSGSLGYPLGQWMCSPANGGALLDFYGMDVTAGSNTGTFADAISVAMAAMTAAGVPAAGPWTIAEAGIGSGWKAPKHQWFSDGWNVAQQIGAFHYMPFFFADFGQPFWPPTDRDVLRVLQDIAAISRGAPRVGSAVVPARSTTAVFVSSANSTGLTATFGSNPVAGSKVLVAVQGGSAATLTVTDNGTTPATFVMDSACLTSVAGVPSVWIFRADNITLPGAGTYAVSVTRSPTGSLQIGACAYTGVQNGPPSASSAVVSTSSIPALYPVIPADVSSLFFSAFFSDSVLNPESITIASPEFTLGAVQLNGASFYPGAIADALVTTPEPRAGGWNLADAPDWAAVMAAYSAFPAAVTIVPGAEAVWAQAPTPSAGVSVSAGVASATGAALAVYPGHNAALAAASGWAAVNAPAYRSPDAGLAPASGAALFDTTGSAVSLTLTASNPVGALAAALAPAVTVTAAPATAAATGAAQGPAVTVALTAVTAVATAAAKTPTATLAVTAAVAAATGAAPQPTVTTGTAPTPATAAATGAGLAPAATVAPNAGTGAATGVPPTPAVTLAPAVPTAAATGAAQAPAATAGATPATAAAAGAAGTVTPTVAAAAAAAAAAGAGVQPTVTTTGATNANAVTAAATGAALSPAVTIAPAPATAAATGVPAKPGLGFTPAAAAATGAGLAPAATVSGTPAAAAATGAGVQPTVVTGVAPTATTATAAGAAAPVTPTVTVTAGLAAATGAAGAVAHGTVPALPTATGAAGQPVASVTPTAGTAAASGTPGGIAHGATPGLATATGAAQAAALAGLAQAAAARALAAALDAAGVGRADFTTGSLTASDAPGSVLTAAAGALGTSGSLTATTQRTGGPS